MAGQVVAEPGRHGWPGLNSFGIGVHAPSYYGYHLDEMSAGYYGGGRYREYYTFQRGSNLASSPGPIIGQPFPQDYRGHHSHPVTIEHAAQPAAPKQPVAQITIEVPAADAIVWIEDQKTQQTGTTRWFVSPPLVRNQDYEYRIRVRWNENGKHLEQTERVTVTAGNHVQVRFPTNGAREVVTAPRAFPLGE
jgi:uncharacterized protein (TIGR03000 family)